MKVILFPSGSSDSGHIEEALNSTAETVELADGEFVVDQPIVYGGAGRVNLHLNPGTVLDASGLAPSKFLLTVAPSHTLPKVSLPTGVVRGERTLPVSVTGWLRVGSNARWTPNTTPDSSMDQKVGELARVDSYGLRWALADSYRAEDGAFVEELDMVEGFTVTGSGQIIGAGVGTNSGGFRFDRCLSPRVEGVSFKNFDDRAVQFLDCVFPRVDRITVEGGDSTDNNFYGVVFNHACQDGSVTNSDFLDCRHAVTCGGSMARSGVNRRIKVSGCSSVRATATAFDSHAGCDGIAFSHCSVYDPVGNGFQARCPKASVTNCTVEGAGVHGIWLRNQSDRPSDYICVGNRVSGTKGNGIKFSPPPEPALQGTTAGQTIDGVVIVGNVVHGTTNAPLWLYPLSHPRLVSTPNVVW